MKAVRLQQYVTVDDVKLEEVPQPVPAEGQVRVRVAAAGVNPIDYKLALGQLKEVFPLQFPWIPGIDFSGVVDAVGRGVSQIKAGDEVFGSNPTMGAYAEFLVAPEAVLLKKTGSITHVEAASVSTVAQTAWVALIEVGKVRAGQRVLIHGGAGGVGAMAIQLAHRVGAKVYTTASAENKDYLLSLGADEVIDYKAVPFESVAQSLDLVLDTLGGPTQQRSLPIVKPGGILVSTVQPPPQDVAQKLGITATMINAQSDPKRLQKIFELVVAGEIKTIVSKTYALSEVKAAWQEILSGHAKGKIVLKI